MRLKWVLQDRVVTVLDLLAERAVGIGVIENHQHLFDAQRLVDIRERQKFPNIGARARVEDEMEPPLRFGETLVLTQVNRDREWDMEEQFPVVHGVRTVGPNVQSL